MVYLLPNDGFELFSFFDKVLGNFKISFASYVQETVLNSSNLRIAVKEQVLEVKWVSFG